MRSRGPAPGITFTDEHRQRLSEAAKRRAPFPHEHRRRLSDAHGGSMLAGKRVTYDERLAILATKPERCECCDRLPGKQGLHLDHDHVTGELRGWLCHLCNRGIGCLGDNLESLEAALAYLKSPLEVAR